MTDLIRNTAKAFKANTARFKRNDRGNFALMFALLSPVLVISAGMMIDVTRLYSAQTKLTAAIDAAVLATTQDLTLGKIPENKALDAVKRWIISNVESTTLRNLPVAINAIDIDKVEKTVAIDASVNVPLTLMKITQGAAQRVTAYTKASYSNTKIEVSMALDVTGSMSGHKIKALKKAADRAVDVLIPTAEAAKRVRIGLVPYAGTVNADPVLHKINYTGSSDGCVYGRTGPHKDTDVFADVANPVSGYKFGVNAQVNSQEGWNHCVTSRILPMTNNVTTLKSRINGFNAKGYTAGHLGVSWAHYMLSPNWNKAWPVASKASGFGSSGTKKFAIIMTDGEFNTHMSSTNPLAVGNRSADSEDTALAHCSAMKNKGIKVYTIAFDAGAAAEVLMQKCANTAGPAEQFYFKATSEAELVEAFEAIAKDIEGLKLIN